MAMTRSWGASVSRISRRRHGRWPANSGWSCGKPAARANDSCHTGQPRRSASPVTASQDSQSSLRPTTSAGEAARSIISASSPSSPVVATALRSVRSGQPAANSSAGSVQSPMGMITSAGPWADTASL